MACVQGGHTLSPHWGNILGVLDALLVQLKENHVPAFLVRNLLPCLVHLSGQALLLPRTAKDLQGRRVTLCPCLLSHARLPLGCCICQRLNAW